MGAVLGMEEGMQGQTIAVVAFQGFQRIRIEDFLLKINPSSSSGFHQELGWGIKYT